MVNPRYKAQSLGSGPIIIELWLDYICPFSKKQFLAIYHEIAPETQKKYPDKFTWVFRHYPQPWHGQGSFVHEAGIAVSQIDPSKFWDFSEKLFNESEKFYDVNTYNKSRHQIVDDLADIVESIGVNRKQFVDKVSIDLSSEFKNPGPAVVDDVKYFVKLGRQNGIHITPTVTINGLKDESISSSWTANQWLEKLRDVLKSVEHKL